MAIQSLYRDYFQKSRVFLYPALDIKRGVGAKPIQTYVSWKGYYKPEDMKFMIMYKMKDINDFKQFERNRLLGNRYFYEFYEVEGDCGVYVFNFSDLKHEWDCFITGRYSKMSRKHKQRVEEFFKRNNEYFAYIQSYLYPERYYRMYADILTTSSRDVPEMIRTLKEVGELCSLPDLELETLDVQVKSLDLQQKMP